MITKKIIALSLLMALSAPVVYGQKKKEKDDENTVEEEDKKMSKERKKAEDAFKSNEFYFASQFYKKAFSKTKSKSEKTEITFLLGECYRHMMDYKQAANQYEKAIKLKYDNPLVYLYLGDMYRYMANYEDAVLQYEEYIRLQPKDQRGTLGLEGAKKAADMKKNRTRYMVENIKDLNTRQDEFGVVYSGKGTEEIYFTSNRETALGKGKDGWQGGKFSDIFVAEAERKTKKGKSKGKNNQKSLNENISYSEPIPVSELINTKFHEGMPTFDRRKRTMYFTRCIKEKSQDVGCAIYVTEKRGQDWGEPEIVVLAPDTSSSVGHPCLSPDEKTLYFASDMAGTMGGKDIWLTTYNRRERKWNDPTNLGPKVNGKGDELYPFAHDDGYLYFSSNTWVGLGGLDVYRIQVGEDGLPIGELENMGVPINSNADDFAIVFEPGEATRGFLSSNRDGGNGGDDLYTVYLAPLVYTIEGVLTSAKSGKPIPQATVRLDGSDGTSTVVNTDKNGVYVFEVGVLQEGISYQLNFEKKKFLSNAAELTTVGIPMESFEFIPTENHFLYGFKISKTLEPIEEPIILPNIFFDLAKWDLRPEAMQSLDSVQIILERNPTIVIELRSHTDYRGDDRSNQILSQNRADTCVKYLISKGIPEDRMIAVGRGENEPFTVTEGYKGFGSEQFKVGTQLTERFIKTQTNEYQEIANQMNRRTDFKVIRDDYVPTAVKVVDEKTGEVKVEAPKEPKIHIVQGRENFGQIATQYGITIKDLRDLNNGLRGVRPFEGLELKVVPGADYTEYDDKRYRADRGDNFSTIARKTGVKVKELKELNPDLKDADILPGSVIFIK